MSFQLDFRTHLPLIIAAVDAKSLSCYDPKTTRCRYVGPCAIGIVLPEEDRATYDGNFGLGTNIGTHFRSRRMTAPGDQKPYWENLQTLHDHIIASRRSDLKSLPHRLAKFEAFVTFLKEKYLV